MNHRQLVQSHVFIYFDDVYLTADNLEGASRTSVQLIVCSFAKALADILGGDTKGGLLIKNGLY